MAVKETFADLPQRVRWVAVPVLALVVAVSVAASVIGLLLKALALVVLITGLVHLVRKFGVSSSRGDW